MNLRNTKEQITRWLPHALLVLLIGTFLITRLWRIGVLPSGIHSDEAGMAYDA